MKKVGREKPRKAPVVAIWSKSEYGRVAEMTPMGMAMRRPRSCAEPMTRMVVGSRCRMSWSTLTRLTNEKPQSPFIMEVNQRT